MVGCRIGNRYTHQLPSNREEGNPIIIDEIQETEGFVRCTRIT